MRTEVIITETEIRYKCFYSILREDVATSAADREVIIPRTASARQVLEKTLGMGSCAELWEKSSAPFFGHLADKQIYALSARLSVPWSEAYGLMRARSARDYRPAWIVISEARLYPAELLAAIESATFQAWQNRHYHFYAISVDGVVGSTRYTEYSYVQKVKREARDRDENVIALLGVDHKGDLHEIAD